MNTERSFFKRNISRALMIAGLLFVIVAFVPNAFFSPFRAVLAPVIAPFQGFLSWIAFESRESLRFVSSVSHLKQVNERLTHENQALSYEIAQLTEMREENRLLREALQLPPDVTRQSVSAEVISRNTIGPSLSLTVNRGSLDGVRTGLPVVVGTGQLVGRIAAVQLSSSTLHLLSHPDSTVAARVAGTSTQGVIRGDHGLGLIFDMALSGEKLEPGARLVTSGLGDDIPKELLIGHIGEIRPSADRLFQQAVVVVPTPENDIRFVSILITPSS